MLRHSFGDGSPSLGCCIGGESPPLVSSFPFFFSFESRTPGLSCMCVSGRGVSEGQKGRGRAGQRPNVGRLVGVRRIRGGNEEGGMGGRRRGRSNRAYGVAVTLLPQKGGAVPESERRRAAWRITEPSHTCLGFLLCCPISSSLSRLGGAVGGRAVRRGVCVCATATKDRSQRTIGFVLLTTKALSKKRK